MDDRVRCDQPIDVAARSHRRDASPFSVRGVGTAFALPLIANMPELGTLDSKPIGSLGGFAPFTRESGQWKGKAAIGGGRPTVRAALFV